MNIAGTAVERWAIRYARIAIGAAFLSAVAGRFGLWTGDPARVRFERFIQRTAELNPYAPDSIVPVLAWAATILETTFGVVLILGIATRWAALGSAVLLAWFATAMAVTAGVKSPLDYSVFSASAGALLLAVLESGPYRAGAHRYQASRDSKYCADSGAG